MSSNTSVGKRSEHLDRTAGEKRSDDTFEARIADVNQLSPTVKKFSFSVEEGSNLELAQFGAGQWVDFFIPGIEKVGGYSMCSTPEDLTERGRLDLAVKASDWIPARWLHKEAKVGDRVRMRVGK
jgi:ferredoxin-NADP reductase